MKCWWIVPAAVAAMACARSDAQDGPGTATGFGPRYVAQLESAQTHGEWVTYGGPGGDSVRAYIAYPMRSGPAPAMIVIHEIFGLSDWVRTVVDDFAAKGYVAIAPDLLTRRGGTTTADSARAIIGRLPPDSVTVDLDATMAYLKTKKSVRGDAIGAIGFCWGGGQSFRYATNNPDLKVAVVCYGPAPELSTVSRIRAAVYGAYGGEDARINANLPEVEQAMRAAGKEYRKKIYPGAGHGFFRSRDVPEQADSGWADIFAFLKENLGS